MSVAVLLLFPVAVAAQELMPASSSAWTTFSPRSQSTPGAIATGEGSGYSLEIHGNGVPSVYGGWRTRISGLTGSSYYRFRARALPVDVASPRESLTILLRWRGSFGDIVAPDYVWQYRTQADNTLLFDRVLQAPPGTTSVDVELVLQWAPNGRVRFDALSFMPATAPAARPVTAAAVFYRPSGASSGLESVQRAAAWGDQVARTHGPDVMVFGELLNVIGVAGTYDDKAESVPGPSTDVMANLARARATNVVFGILERQDTAGGLRLLYNTAVLIGRDGTIVGKYRKVQLPLSEVSAGITPGNSVPVFQADFGRVALLICQDTAFPEPAREAAVQGAEMLLVPIWGGKPSAVHARAIEQSMYVVASGYDYLSEVVNPLGSVLDVVTSLGQADAAVATIDLSQRFREEWIGDWRDTANKQRRTAPYTADDTGGTEPPPPPPANVPPIVALTSPSNGGSYTEPAAIAMAASASDSDGTIARIDFYSGTTLLGSDASSPFGFTWSGVGAGSYSLTARAVDNAGASATSSSVSVTVSAAPPPPPPGSLPSPWQTQDIGAVGVPGTASASGGTFTVDGAGADIWGTADAFRYVWQPVTGDVDVVARVVSVEYVQAWVKAGVMIRERLTADSPHAFMLVSAGRGLAFQRRPTIGGLSTSTSAGAGTAPAWVKLERRRSDNSIRAYYSVNGSTWTLVGTQADTMAESVYVGLAVSSHDASALATAAFANVSVITTEPPLPAGWQAQDIGAVGVAGEANATAGTFTVRGSGADVWNSADAFHYAWRRLSGDGEIVARVASVEYVHAWVKAGVMVRERLTADSPHAFMFASPGKGLAFQRRVAAAGFTTGTSTAGAAPAWVKLERRASVISAYRSADGVTWTLVGSDTFTMGADVYVGLAVSSHDNTRLATAVFDNVSVR